MTVVFLGGTGNTTITGGTGNVSINGVTGIIPPVWTTATRPSSPVPGQQGWNANVGYEIYTDSWQTLVAKG